MKYLLIGITFLFASNLSAQNFMDSQESMEIIESNKLTDESALTQVPPNDPNYQLLKNNLKAYQIFENHIESDLPVAESIMMAVLEVMPEDVSIEEYETDDFPNSELLRLKNHLVQLLSN